MAVVDYTKRYPDLAAAGPVQTPNTVSRNDAVGERAFATVVWESGKMVLDSELQLGQDAFKWEQDQLRQWEGPSGWMRGQTKYAAINDYTMGTDSTVSDDSGLNIVTGPDDTLVNGFVLPRLVAMVAGRPIVVEYTNTQTADKNLIELEEPTIWDGTAGTVRRTDFVFLEVWYALVAPSPVASGTVTIAAFASITPGDVITINGVNLTAVAGAPAVDQFQIGASNAATALNVYTAINDVANSFDTIVVATISDAVVTIKSFEPGAVGNAITLATTVVTPGCITVSGALLAGGADRPSKPAAKQGKIYRHGNVLSPAVTWLDDDILDPDVGAETSQRVQIQYRIRHTGATETINYKTHPDGFSNTVSPPLARGGTATVAGIAGYPFVPADNATISTNSSAVAYGMEDSGLWVAGDGSAAAAVALGTVDGYVYAIPICFIHRHNNASDAAGVKGFEPSTNSNGAPTFGHGGYTGILGAIAAGKSDRPDGGFCDVVTETNLLDLRRHVQLSGLDLSAETLYQIQSLLDGSLRSWSVSLSDKQQVGDGTGDVSTRPLVCDEIGRSIGNPASTRGEFIREFDHIARRFGDQSVVERWVIAFYPGDRSVADPPSFAPGIDIDGKYVTKAAGTDEWAEGDVLHLDLDTLNAGTLGGVFQGLSGDWTNASVGVAAPMIGDYLPTGAVISDVLSVFHDDGHSDVAIDQTVQLALVTGLGTRHLELALDLNDLTANGAVGGDPDYVLVGDGIVASSPRRIFLEVEVTYPIGEGTSCAPDLPLTPDATVYNASTSGVGFEGAGPGAMTETDVTTRPSDMQAPLAPRFRSSYREVQQEYLTTGVNTIGAPVPMTPITESIVSRDRTTLYTPRRIYGDAAFPVTVDDEQTGAPVAMTVDANVTEYGASTRKIALTSNLSGAGQSLCTVEYFGQDPLPNFGPLGSGYSIAVYYRSNAPQTAGVRDGVLTTATGSTLPTTLRVEPLKMGSDVWTGQVGAGSVDRAFPYAQPLDQIPDYDPSGATPEWFFCGTSDVSVADFESNTGLLSLHPFVQADSQNEFQFGGLASPPTQDTEFRAFYSFAADWVYRPTILSQPLYGAVRHKVFFPFLARVVEEVPAAGGDPGGLLYRKNEVVLMVLSRHATLDNDNSVKFVDTDNATIAALYRTRNLLLLAGDKTTPVPVSGSLALESGDLLMQEDGFEILLRN